MNPNDPPAPAGSGPSRSAPAWLAAALSGQRAGMARAITAIEDNTPDAAAVLAALYPLVGRALVVGFTGAPGAGKSTLVAAVIAAARRRKLGVGVIAIDPSSPLSGGAVLGDRIRMLDIASDPGVYVRSLAARGHLGGLSAVASRVVDLLDAAGKDLIIVETVGIGQSETEVSRLAQLTVMVCAPGMGDEVQMIKAGVLEIADLFAVNKADLADAQGLLRQLQALAHQAPVEVPVVPTIATSGQGADVLLDALLRLRTLKVLPPEQERQRRLRQALQSMAVQTLAARLAGLDEGLVGSLCAAVLRGECGMPAAVEQLLDAAR